MKIAVPYIIFFFLASTALAQSDEIATHCEELVSEGFFDEMKRMVEGAELCFGECESPPILREGSVAFRIFSESVPQETLAKIESSLLWILEDLSTVIDRTMFISNTTPESNYETAFYVLPIDATVDRFLITDGLPGLTSLDYVNNHRMSLLTGSCSARVVSEDVGNGSFISLAYIFITPEALIDQPSLDFCLLEEITNAIGLFGDPAGNVSLLGNGNFELDNGRPINSIKTKAMLRFLYSGVPFDEKNFSTYVNKGCRLKPEFSKMP